MKNTHFVPNPVEWEIPAKPTLTQCVIVGKSYPLKDLLPGIIPGVPMQEFRTLNSFRDHLMKKVVTAGTLVAIDSSGLGGEIDQVLGGFDHLRGMAFVFYDDDSPGETRFTSTGRKRLKRVIEELFAIPR